MPTLTIRGVDQDVYDRFRLAAKMRDMTQGEYLAGLVQLHDLVRQAVDHGDLREFFYWVRELGLETVEG